MTMTYSRLAFYSLLSAFLGIGFFFPAIAQAQNITFDLGQGPTTSARLVQLTLLITVLALAPSILVMVTCFTRIVVVLSFLRTAIGIQQTPPNVVMISLALFLTMFVMQPVFQKAWDDGISPLMNSEIDEETSFTRSVEPFHAFMLKNTRSRDIDLFLQMAKIDVSNTPDGQRIQEKDIPLRALIPAFMISELRRAFEIGFLLFVPFLIIDMVIASLLMSMGMMMMPPSVISMPFKIVFFVLVDGWHLIASSLVQSYGLG